MADQTYRKKLIEVALPLEAINRESAREKSIRHGHPSTLHLWWARRPLAACRAVLFASLVDDPSSRPEEFVTEEAQDRERQRLFRIIEELVKWDNSGNEAVLAAARHEIVRSTSGKPPAVLDPFCGGGSIPLEAQRLGLEAQGSDLNPVPVLITKALIDFPHRFAGQAPVNPEARRSMGHSGRWPASAGLADDVRYYGKWMRDEAERRIGHLYPKIKLSATSGGGDATVIAWLWTRTITCPNPACGAKMPLLRSFALNGKKGQEAWVEPVIDRSHQPPKISFTMGTGRGTPPEGTVNRRGATCLACRAPVTFEYVRSEAKAKRMGDQLMAIVAEGSRRRVYLAPSVEQEQVALGARGGWYPEGEIAHWPGRTNVVEYGMTRWGDLFTPRQLLAMTTFSDLAAEVHRRVLDDVALAEGVSGGKTLAEGGSGPIAYADAVTIFCAFAVSKAASRNCSLAIWEPGMGRLAGAFGRQSLPMQWSYAETNPLAGAGGDIAGTAQSVSEVLDRLVTSQEGQAVQRDARHLRCEHRLVVSTDPPYYDNIPYADLSDFFYVWLRRTLGHIETGLLSTLLTPKTTELIAAPSRHGGNWHAAAEFFEHGLLEVFQAIHRCQHPEFPLTIFYAFKQAEGDEGKEGRDDTVPTGWETFLEGVIAAGFVIDGTWPMRTEDVGSLKRSQNVLATSVVLVCRPRQDDALSTTRRQFLSELQRELPAALRALQHGNIAPVDLAQAAIGPGMAVFTRYARVLESDGASMSVRTALMLINQLLAQALSDQDGEMDADTRWAVTWFDQFGFVEGPFGDANTLANAKNTSTQGLVEAGIVHSARGKVRLLRRDELREGWDPREDDRRTVWEATHYLISALDGGGEQLAAALLIRLGSDAERARDLAYRLYTTCERRGWTQDAQAYNSLVVAWPELTRLATSADSMSSTPPNQPSLEL